MSKNKGKPVLSASAIAHGREHARQLFDGRRGHGGETAKRILVTATELEDNLAVAYQLGAQQTAMLSKVSR